MAQKKLKPFDLEAALAGQLVQLRDGSTARICGYEPNAFLATTSIVGYVASDRGIVHLCGWCLDGRYSEHSQSGLDIIGMAPVETTYYIGVYKVCGGIVYTTTQFDTEAEVLEVLREIESRWSDYEFVKVVEFTA